MYLKYPHDRLGKDLMSRNSRLKKHLLIALGWFFILLATVGVVLPLLPTTPFLIVALALFSKSSPRFHQMLLQNAVFGPSLKQWEETRTLSRETKHRSFALIAISFSLSIWAVSPRINLQIMLVSLAVILVFFIWRVKEEA